MSSLIRRIPSSLARSLLRRNLCTAVAAEKERTKKLERIADELLSLTSVERNDYSILFRHKMGLDRFASSAAMQSSSFDADPAPAPEAAKEKTAFNVKLEKFDPPAKLKVIKEIRAFTDLGLKEAKDLVEKTPSVVKKGVSMEEAEKIVAKLKEVGATAVLE